MTIDELDIDDECMGNDIFEIQNNCLAVFSSENNFKGTGFLIDDDGTFISAGHIFKNADLEYYVYYRDSKYDYKTICFEYREYNKYTSESQICEDLFIGKLLDFHEEIVSSFHLSKTSSLNINDTVFVIGYQTCPQNIVTDMTINDISLYLNKICPTLCCANGIITNKNNLNLDSRLKMKNILTLKIENIEKCHGLSGGPVFREKEIFGVLIADMFISSEYILQKLGEYH